ncbi:hypothetical protein C8A00DRAFT_41217 [Chaetomidium leptoderma]|uniref:Uncharacterized protein n=1 Tax=Chaetomidium leptoderma TaxID=669021 RepID=A0AAN6VRV1_9PEZI|nr:hypothetical protein C8A00DRAFT_41217 [Chaetomidium leptoderma]
MGLGRLLGHLLATLVLAACLSSAAATFTNSFDGIASGSSVVLTWDGLQPQQYPLCITAQVIDKNGDGFRANSYRANITTGATGTSFTWISAPYPLRWIPGGLYQLELRPMSWTGGHAQLLATSPFFSISETGTGAGSTTGTTGTTGPQPTPADSQGGDASGISTPVAIGLGVAIGVPSIAATLIVGLCLRKRQRRAAMEKRRLKRSEFVIS